MRMLIVTFTVLIIVLSCFASLEGALSYGHARYRLFTTARGETVKVQDAGIYRYSAQNLVTGGAPWDFVRLLVCIPILLVSFMLHLRGSLRGTVLFIGSLANFLYQYLLWTFAWAYNSLFLVYVMLYSLSLWTLILVLANVKDSQIKQAFGGRFPVRLTATFSFVVGGTLFLKCLGEVLPGLSAGSMPAGAEGYYTLVDQGLDIGLVTPFCVVSGILLLRRRALGYLLSASSLLLFLCIGVSVVIGEAMLGLATGSMNLPGIVVFSVFLVAALWLLIAALARMTNTPHVHT